MKLIKPIKTTYNNLHTYWFLEYKNKIYCLFKQHNNAVFLVPAIIKRSDHISLYWMLWTVGFGWHDKQMQKK